MEFLKPEYGLAGICILLTISILVKVGEFLWKLREKKESASDEAVKSLILAVNKNTFAIEHLEGKFQGLEKTLSEFPKIKVDLRRYFQAMKLVSGDQWPEIRKQIMEDEIIL